MKRYGRIAAACLGAALLAGSMAGCGAAPLEQPSAETEDAKALRIEKRSCQTGETAFLLEDDAQAAEFYEAYFNPEDPFEAMDISLSPEGLTPEWEYIVYQEKTIHAGEKKSAGYEEILRYTLYEDSDVMTMEVVPGVAETEGLAWLGDALTWSYEGDAQRVAWLKQCTMEDLT